MISGKKGRRTAHKTLPLFYQSLVSTQVHIVAFWGWKRSLQGVGFFLSHTSQPRQPFFMYKTQPLFVRARPHPFPPQWTFFKALSFPVVDIFSERERGMIFMFLGVVDSKYLLLLLISTFFFDKTPPEPSGHTVRLSSKDQSHPLSPRRRLEAVVRSLFFCLL